MLRPVREACRIATGRYPPERENPHRLATGTASELPAQKLGLIFHHIAKAKDGNGASAAHPPDFAGGARLHAAHPFVRSDKGAERQAERFFPAGRDGRQASSHASLLQNRNIDYEFSDSYDLPRPRMLPLRTPGPKRQRRNSRSDRTERLVRFGAETSLASGNRLPGTATAGRDADRHLLQPGRERPRGHRHIDRKPPAGDRPLHDGQSGLLPQRNTRTAGRVRTRRRPAGRILRRNAALCLRKRFSGSRPAPPATRPAAGRTAAATRAAGRRHGNSAPHRTDSPPGRTQRTSAVRDGRHRRETAPLHSRHRLCGRGFRFGTLRPRSGHPHRRRLDPRQRHRRPVRQDRHDGQPHGGRHRLSQSRLHRHALRSDRRHDSARRRHIGTRLPAGGGHGAALPQSRENRIPRRAT